MKNLMQLTKRIGLGLALVCAVLLFGIQSTAEGATKASEPKPKSKTVPGSRLIVQRSPNFGTNLVVQVWIDGKKIANIPRDQHYGGMISAGRHSLTILALPNTLSRRATSIRVSVKPGKTYIYTAAWNRDRLILQPSWTYIPTHAVKPITEKRKPGN